jgi:hypothetical protein
MMEFGRDDDLRGARFTEANLAGARFRDVVLTDARITGALLDRADISGSINGLKVNGIEVAPLVERELTRLHPERAKLSAVDPDGLREAWSTIEELWEPTLARARRLPEARLHERVDDEWSFVETLRHLVFVTDAWISRTVLGAAGHYHPLGLPHSENHDTDALQLDHDADPTFDEVLDARRSRMATVRDVVDRLTPGEAQRTCAANPAPGYPPQTVFQVRACLGIVFDEEWWHHQYATRDLDELERRERSRS